MELERRSFLKLGALSAIAGIVPNFPKIAITPEGYKNRPEMEHGFLGFFKGHVTKLMFERSDGVVSHWGNGVCLRLAPELTTERETVFSLEYTIDLYHTRQSKEVILHLVISEIGQINTSEDYFVSSEEMKQVLGLHEAKILAENICHQ